MPTFITGKRNKENKRLHQKDKHWGQENKVYKVSLKVNFSLIHSNKKLRVIINVAPTVDNINNVKISIIL